MSKEPFLALGPLPSLDDFCIWLKKKLNIGKKYHAIGGNICDFVFYIVKFDRKK